MLNNFTILQNCIDQNNTNIDIEEFNHPLYKRFITSYKNDFKDRSLLDVTVLLRQILLNDDASRNDNISASLKVPSSSLWPSEEEYKKVNIEFSKFDNGHYFNIYAKWWRPNWLEGSTQQSVDFNAISENNARDNVHFKSNVTDIFLKSLNHKDISYYKSNDQQRAVRSALTLNSAETLAISLPTGEGKSLIFQLINLLGFSDSNTNGLTLIIVPTVTLALDQEKNMQKLLNNNNPYAFVSKKDNENNILKENIRNGEQSICFISPEAAYGPLQNSLIQSAQNGLIKAIIVDEAHIIEEWGTDFRSEFQMFSGLWRQLLDISPQANKFRTIMLSATYTQSAIDTIKTLFSYSENSFKIFNATKLRPEIDYWIADKVDEQTRKERVLESILHLPRPLILYTTKVEDANKYYEFIKKEGFKNIAIVTGASNTDDRDNIINKWKDGTLDFVVATSAFGLGIDYKHTRSVVHACIPETLNRFYQEVGRGGRDGKSSISLLLPSYIDIKTAKSMNAQSIITEEVGFPRWKGMFDNKESIDNEESKYIIDLYAKPHLANDYTKKGLKDWNIKVLILMAKANLIQLCGVPRNYSTDNEDFNRYIIIRIIDENHLDNSIWDKATSKIRDSIYDSNKESLNLFLRFMEQKECPADIISRLYEITVNSKEYDVAKLCSSCILCRDGNKIHTNSPFKRVYPLTEDENHIKQVFGYESIMVEYTLEDINKIRRFESKFTKVIANLIKHKIYNFMFTEESKKLFLTEKIQNKINKMTIFIETINKLSEVTIKSKNYPKGGLVLFLDPNIEITSQIINILNKQNSIIFILKDINDPVTKQRKLTDVYRYEMIQIEEFIEKASL